MSDLLLLSTTQMKRIEALLPRSCELRRVDDRRVVSGIVYVIWHGLQWKDAPPGYWPHKRLYNRFVRWSGLGVFTRFFAALAAEGGRPERLIIDATPESASHGGKPHSKGGAPRRIGRTKSGRNAKLHAVYDGQG